MAGSVNKVILVGNLGADPEVRNLNNGGKVVNLSIATSESWKDKNTGEKREKTEWHRVVIWNEGLAGVAEKYLSKGDKVYLEGELQTRKWQDQEGNDRYATEVVLTGFGGTLVMLSTQRSASDQNDNSSRPGNRSEGGSSGGGGSRQSSGRPGSNRQQAPAFEPGGMDDDIPF